MASRHEVREALRVVLDPQEGSFYQDPEFHQDVRPEDMQAILDDGHFQKLRNLDGRTQYTHAVQDVFGRWTLLRCVPVSPCRQ